MTLVRGLSHVAVVTADLDRLTGFYVDLFAFGLAGIVIAVLIIVAVFGGNISGSSSQRRSSPTRADWRAVLFVEEDVKEDA